MAFWFKTSKLRPYKACKSLADTPISQKLANILTGLAYLQGAPICTTEIHSAESGWLVGTCVCIYPSHDHIKSNQNEFAGDPKKEYKIKILIFK